MLSMDVCMFSCPAFLMFLILSLFKLSFSSIWFCYIDCFSGAVWNGQCVHLVCLLPVSGWLCHFILEINFSADMLVGCICLFILVMAWPVLVTLTLYLLPWWSSVPCYYCLVHSWSTIFSFTATVDLVGRNCFVGIYILACLGLSL